MIINKLTSEPISKEMLDVLERLKSGETVSLNEINNLPEIRYAYSCISSNIPTIEIKGREMIQENVLKRLQKMGSAVANNDGTVSFSGEIRCEKRLDIVIGLPAAGKSSALAEPLSEFYKSRIVDSDEAKKMLPGFDNGWGAGTVHKESQKISNVQLDLALEKGENITYPRVGGDCDEMKAIISRAKRNGYKVYVHFNELDRNKAMGRMLERYLNTGRFLKPDLITKYGDSISDTYRELKKSNLRDGYSKWNNDVPLGERPKLIEYSGSCKDFCRNNKQKTYAENREDILSEQIKQLSAQVKQLKADNSKLLGLVNEVNTIFRENPVLSKAYKEKRDEHRNHINYKQEKQPPKR